MKKEIPIVSNPDDLRKTFRQYVRILNPILRLRDKESDVLAELLYYNNTYKELPKDVRWKMVFDHDTKIKIREELEISQASLDNTFSFLRKRNIIKNNQIIDSLVIYPEFPFELTFKFTT